MKTNIKQLNPQVLLEAAALLAVATWLSYDLISGRYLVYVTPRMTPYLIGAVIVLSIWAAVALTRLFRPITRARVLHSFVLILPLLLLLLPHGDVSASADDFSTTGASVATGTTKTAAPSSTPDRTSATQEPQSTVETQDAPAEEIAGLDRDSKTITLSTEDFYAWISRFYNEPSTYKGYTVCITGYVINGTDVFAENEFALARLMMSCCVADLSPVGLICVYDQAADLVADDWISLEGTLTVGNYELDGQTFEEPQLLVTNITPTEEIAGYVYPY